MAFVRTDWVTTPSISIRDVARGLGFDIACLERLPEDVQATLRKSIIREVLETIGEAWYDYGSRSALSEVNKGVYVISLDGRMAVDYGKRVNNVLYIGRGSVLNRLKAHLGVWMLDLSASMKEVEFKIHICEPVAKGPGQYFKDFEAHLIDTFFERVEEKPLINKIRGRVNDAEHDYSTGWDKPINMAGYKFLWAIKPLPANPWFKEMVDD